MSEQQRKIVENLAIDIRLLQYFSKAYELGSFAKASDALYISRQALRYGIKSIEEQLGCTLFTSQSNRLRPTREGETLYSLSRETLEAYDRMQLQLVEQLVNKRRRHRCGQTAGCHELWSHEELNRRRQEYMGRPYVFVTGSCDFLRKELRDGKLDSVSLITDQSRDDEFDYTHQSSGQLYLMANKEHPLATKSRICIEDLRGQRFVSQGDGFDLHHMLENACQKAGFALSVVYTGLDFFELAGQVNANAGLSYSLIPKANHYDSSNIVYIPFDESFQWHVLILRRKA